MTPKGIAAERKVDMALKSVIFPFLCFYTRNYVIFLDSEKKTRPYKKLIYNKISNKTIHLIHGQMLLYTPSLRIGILAIK